jgi:predicted phage terminase large subunit-like protein
MGEVSPIILLDAIKEEKRIRYMEESLSEFARGAWHILEPVTELKWGWALDAICDHLEAVSDGEILRLLMNVPPGSMKSLLTGVIWPAWEWGPRGLPHLRYLSTAHKQDLAVRDNLKCRRLIQSRWYQDRWPITLTGDQNAKTKFENDRTGFREAMAFTSMTGSRGDRVILDDPLSVDDANSEAALNAAETTFREALPTRVNNDDSAIVVIMQRLHEKDTSGIIINGRLGYEHLCLPMEFEESRRCTTLIGFVDPRKADGELLFPERFSEATVTAYKKTLGEVGYAGQMQQRPSPAGGGILKISHFQMWPRDQVLPVFDYVVQSVDPAYTEKTSGDPTAFAAWGVFTHKGKRGAMLLDCWADHLGFPQLLDKLIDEWHSVYGKTDSRRGKKPDALLIEAKASGMSLIQSLRQSNLPALPYVPDTDKVNRAHQAAPILELDCLWIPESNKNPGEFVSWAKPFLHQVELFPNAEHDDMVDTFTQMIIYLRDGRWFELPEAEFDAIEDLDYYRQRKAKINPYAA